MKQLLLLSCLSIFLLTSCDEAVVEPVDTCVLTDTEVQVVAELDQVLHSFTNSSPNAPKEELSALNAQFTQSRIVAMGEATHGTFEFFEMKHRLFKYLVEEHNYRAIVFEANFANTLAVNEYVLTGIGELNDVVAKMNFWTWQTDEVKALIIWMRGYNIGKPDNEKIFFYGSDCQYKDDEIALVLDYLNQVDTSYHTIADSLYTPFRDISTGYSVEPDTSQIAILHNINLVVAHLENKENDYIAKSNVKSYELALQTAKVVVQVEEVLSKRNPYARDKYMGENTVWWSDYIGNDAKVAFWAHNYHVMTNDWGWNTAGGQIEEMIGDEFMTIGFSHSAGKFNAVHKVGNSFNGLREHALVESECNSFNFVAKHASADKFYFILDEIEAFDALNDWLSAEQRFFMVGAVYDRDAPENYYASLKVKTFFDVVIHFDETRASVF